MTQKAETLIQIKPTYLIKKKILLTKLPKLKD